MASVALTGAGLAFLYNYLRNGRGPSSLFCATRTTPAARPVGSTRASTLEHAPNGWLEAFQVLQEVFRLMYTETLGRWNTVDLFIGLAYLSNKDDTAYAAADIAAAGTVVDVYGPLEDSEALKMELAEVRRYMLYCQGLKFKKAETQARFWIDNAGISQEHILLQQATAGLLRPAYVLIRDDVLRKVVLCIRGTKSMKDLFTSLTGATKPHHHITPEGVTLGYSHLGMLAAARWLQRQVTPLLKQALIDAGPGYEVRIVGHSMGGGTAAMLTMMIREKVPELAHVQCVAIACPACMTRELAMSCRGFITSVICGTDIVPTFCAASVDALREDVTASSWFAEFQRDLRMSVVSALAGGVRGLGTAGSWTARNILTPATLPLSSCYSRTTATCRPVRAPLGAPGQGPRGILVGPGDEGAAEGSGVGLSGEPPLAPPGGVDSPRRAPVTQMVTSPEEPAAPPPPGDAGDSLGLHSHAALHGAVGLVDASGRAVSSAQLQDALRVLEGQAPSPVSMDASRSAPATPHSLAQAHQSPRTPPGAQAAGGRRWSWLWGSAPSAPPPAGLQEPLLSPGKGGERHGSGSADVEARVAPTQGSGLLGLPAWLGGWGTAAAPRPASTPHPSPEPSAAMLAGSAPGMSGPGASRLSRPSSTASLAGVGTYPRAPLPPVGGRLVASTGGSQPPGGWLLNAMFAACVSPTRRGGVKPGAGMGHVRDPSHSALDTGPPLRPGTEVTAGAPSGLGSQQAGGRGEASEGEVGTGAPLPRAPTNGVGRGQEWGEDDDDEEEEQGEQDDELLGDTDIPGLQSRSSGGGREVDPEQERLASGQLQAGITAVVAAVTNEPDEWGQGTGEGGALGLLVAEQVLRDSADSDPGIIDLTGLSTGSPRGSGRGSMRSPFADALPGPAVPLYSRAWDEGELLSPVSAAEEAAAMQAALLRGQHTGEQGAPSLHHHSRHTSSAPAGMVEVHVDGFMLQAPAAPGPTGSAVPGGADFTGDTPALPATRPAHRKLYPAGRLLHFLPQHVVDAVRGGWDPELPVSSPAQPPPASPPPSGVSAAAARRPAATSDGSGAGSTVGNAGVGADQRGQQGWALLHVGDPTVYCRVKLCRTMVMDHFVSSYLTALDAVVASLDANIAARSQ